MRNIALIDETFDSNVTSAYHLSIQYSEQFCSFSILDSLRMEYIAFKNFWFPKKIPAKNQADHIRSLLHGESYLSLPYKSIQLMYHTPVSVLVPAPLFSPDNPEIYFKYSAVLHKTDQILIRKIPSVDAFVLFALPEEFVNQAGIILHDVKFYHQSCTLIGQAMSDFNGRGIHPQVVAHINAGFADLMVIRQGQLLLYNSFAIRNTNDLVFFILYLYEQFGLSQEDSPVILSGFPEMYPGVSDLLGQYLKNILMQGFPEGFAYSQVFDELSQHNFSPLIHLARCV